MSEPIITINNLSIGFASKDKVHYAVKDLNLSVTRNRCLGIVGESGSGKSLSALAMMQLLPSQAIVTSSSQILYNDIDILNQSERQMRKIRGRQIGMIFQDAMSALNPVFTIGNQMLETIKQHRFLDNGQAREVAIQLLTEVGLPNPELCLARYPHQLSGGMRQRAMVAMALCPQPDILIADEPTTALDVTIQAQVIELLQELQKQHSMTLIFISHDLAVVSNLADDIVVMEKGCKVEENATADFFANPQQDYSKRLLAAIPSNTPRHTTIPSAKPLLKVSNLKVHFPIQSKLLKRKIGAVKAVDGVSFNLACGETLALVGESGSGKTTTGKSILHLLHQTDGQVFLESTDLSQLSRRAMRVLRHDMQIIFQDPFASLNPRMLVVDCIAEGLLTQRKVSNREQAIIKIDEMLELVGLPLDSKWRYPHQFSGGERQRICIARALALEPKLLILDEPTSALDVSIQMQVLKLLEQLQQEYQLSYLLITHNISVVAYMAHSVAVMYHGKIVEQGSTEQILLNPVHDYTKRLLTAVPQINTREQHG